MNKFLRYILVVASLFVATQLYAEVERVIITVTNDRHALLPEVTILEVDSRNVVGRTDNNGVVVVDVVLGKKTRFWLEEYSGFYKKKLTELDGKVKDFKVVLETSKDIVLKETVVTGNRKAKKGLKPRESITKIKGDTLVTTCAFPIDSLMSKDVRVIVQPFFLDSTTHKKYYTEPFVLDGNEYHTTQIRMYDYKESNLFNDAIPNIVLRSANPVYDPLYNNIVEKNDSLRYIDKTKTVVKKTKNKYYKDSLIYNVVERPKKEWGVLAEIPMKLVANTKLRNEHFWCAGAVVSFEDYNKILYTTKGELFSIGMRNPMRFFEYKLKGTELKEDTAKWYPVPNLAKQEKADKINIRFAKAKSDIDMNDSVTVAELGKLKASVDAILSDEDAQFREVTVIGTASPEGRYGSNLNLANDRLATLLNWVRGIIPEEKRVRMYPQKEGRVAEWREVSELMRKDSLVAEADAVDEIIAKYKREESRGAAIRKLAFYSVIEEKYLPQLRRVEYKLGYSIDRVLTYEDILRRIEENPNFVPSAYESFVLYRNEKDPVKRLELCKLAYEKHPNTLLFANDYSAMLISAGKPNPKILEGYDVERINHRGQTPLVPATVHINQLCARLLTDNIVAADTLDQMITAREDLSYLNNSQFVAAHTYLDLKQGNYNDDNYDVVKKTGLRNEVVFLLARNTDSEDQTEDDVKAASLCEQLSDTSSVDCVLKAIAISRTKGKTNEKVVEYLKKAFELDPTMEKTCGGEADLQKALATIRKERMGENNVNKE